MGATIKQWQLLTGVLVGVVISTLGSFLFIELLTDYGYFEGIKILRETDSLGKLITVSTMLNIIAFFTLLRYNKDMMAWGVVAAAAILTIVTLFI